MFEIRVRLFVSSNSSDILYLFRLLICYGFNVWLLPEIILIVLSGVGWEDWISLDRIFRSKLFKMTFDQLKFDPMTISPCFVKPFCFTLSFLSNRFVLPSAFCQTVLFYLQLFVCDGFNVRRLRHWSRTVRIGLREIFIRRRIHNPHRTQRRIEISGSTNHTIVLNGWNCNDFFFFKINKDFLEVKLHYSVQWAVKH
jgi:hypothetical protein